MPPLEAADAREAIARLCENIAAREEELANTNLCERVWAREEQMSTALGHGVAVPHARLPEIARPFLFLARSKGGIAWDAEDGDPVRIVFLLVTPESDPEIPLFLLRNIALAVRDPQTRKRLEEASPAAVLEILREKSIEQAERRPEICRQQKE